MRAREREDRHPWVARLSVPTVPFRQRDEVPSVPRDHNGNLIRRGFCDHPVGCPRHEVVAREQDFVSAMDEELCDIIRYVLIGDNAHLLLVGIDSRGAAD